MQPDPQTELGDERRLSALPLDAVGLAVMETSLSQNGRACWGHPTRLQSKACRSLSVSLSFLLHRCLLLQGPLSSLGSVRLLPIIVAFCQTGVETRSHRLLTAPLRRVRRRLAAETVEHRGEGRL